MKKYLGAMLAAFGLVSPAQAQHGQVNPYEQRAVELDAIDRIMVDGPFRTTVFVSDGPARLVLFGPPQLLADALAEVEDGQLVIRFREGAAWSWNPGSGMYANIHLPSLAAAELEGAGSIDIYRVHGEVFSATTGGAGSITLHNMDVGSAHFATAGAGGIVAEGRARDGVFATAGAGSIDAKRLRVTNADISSAGAGSVLADVSGLANVALAGSGDADIVGGAECNVQETGSGRAECR